jgi:hypothetical protein
LICDWWFKVDCSKSVDLYEQSAEYLAEEERKRIENKKMNSEFHRSNNNDNNPHFYQSTNYDGRQNGRMNPYGKSAVQNQLPNVHNTKSTESFDLNYIYEKENTKSNNKGKLFNAQYIQDSLHAKDEYNKPQNDRQQNQLPSNDVKLNQANIYDQRNSNKYYNNQLKSSQEDEYYGSAANVNAQREEKQNIIKSAVKSRTFTRQNFNIPIQKVTPAYTETTTFRTSTTTSPIREFQHLAESAAFASNRGNRYKSHNSNQFNSFYSNNKASTLSSDIHQQQTTSTTVNSSKDRNSPQTFVRSRVEIPAFPGPTFSPIYKPRTTTLPTKDLPTTVKKEYTNKDYDRQDYQSTTYLNYETTTTYPEYTTTESQFTSTPNVYHNKNINGFSTTLKNDGFTTVIPTTENFYYAKDIYKETTPAVTTTIKYNTEESVTQFNDNYAGSPTTLTPIIYKNGYNLNTVSSNTVDEKNTPAVTRFPENIESQSEKFESSKNLLKPQSQTYFQNSISVTTEKPNRGVYDSIPTRKTPSPYDTSVTYQHGKIISTLGPYIPFTKNYAFTTSSTTIKPNYSATNTYYNQISKNIISNSKSSQNFATSNFGKSGSRATYLPEKTTQATYIIQSNNYDSKLLNEREHVLNMLKSLQGLEKNLPNLNINHNRTGLEIPSSSGPSTLHSLALYFANAENNSDVERATDSTVNIKYAESMINSIQKKNTSVIELPSNILTQHTISSYAELFNLNNALENNITDDVNYDNSDENSTDEDTSDLDIQQSEGPLSGVKKSNNTKLRELAQVFTQALSAYLQDPDTFKKVLTEIRPTEPSQAIENEITTASSITTEDYPSVTKEKDEVLDFSDDINSIRKRRPTTTVIPETSKDLNDIARATTYQQYYTSDYLTTTTTYPDESLNEAQSGYIHNQGLSNSNDNLAYKVNNVFDSKKLNEDKNYKTNSYDLSSSSNSNKNYENYFPIEQNKYGIFQNNSTKTFSPYGKYVKPSNATPINDNYVASSTPASFEVAAPQIFSPSKTSANINDKLYDHLTPPLHQILTSAKPINSNPNTNAEIIDTHVTPIYKKYQETVTTTREPFRIRYYDTTTLKQHLQSPTVASSIDTNYKNPYNSLDSKTETPITNHRYTNPPSNHHWTSSPTVTQLWETTVFINPEHINRGLDTEQKISQSSDNNYRDTTPTEGNVLQNSDDNAVTSHNFLNDPSTPWQWGPNSSDSPTAFTLLPNIYSSVENTATPTSTYTTRSSLTTIRSSVSTTNAIPSTDDHLPTTVSVYNVTENEIEKAHQMFGNLNETSSNTLMKVMKQADNNTTVRQLVLLLISHCNGPMNKTMEQEKEQLLNALLKMPVNEFNTEESRELIRGISNLQLPIGKSTSEMNNPTTTSIFTTTIIPSLSEPSVTTFRSRSGRKFKTTTEKSYTKVSNKIVEKFEKTALSESKRTAAIEDETASDNRALDLLRSLYTITAKWG